MSTLTTIEYVNLVAEFSKDDEQKIDYKAKGYNEATIAQIKKNKKDNFKEYLNIKFATSLHDFNSCFNYQYLVQLYNGYENKNILPFQGSLSEQPNKIIEVFNVLKALVNEKQEKLNKKNNK